MRRGHFVLLAYFLCFVPSSAGGQVVSSFGAISLGSASTAQTLTYNFSAATTLSAVNIVTAGAAGLDYGDGGGSSCGVGTAYNPGDSCTVTVVFTPTAPGPRYGALLLFAQGSSLPLMTSYLSGVGVSGAVTIDPGAQSTIAALANSGLGYGVVIDGGGNIYVSDYANSQILEVAAGTHDQTAVVASGLSNPTAVALDGAGNLYICDTGHSRVVMVPNEQGVLNPYDLFSIAITGLGSPSSLTLDTNANLYVADTTNGTILEVPAGGGSPVTIASGLMNPQAVAVDVSGNVYVASAQQVSEYPAGGGTPVSFGTGYSNPSGLAVDASGAVYIVDAGAAQIVVVTPGGASQTTLAKTGLINPQGIALDPEGNVYVTDSGNLYAWNRTQPAALAFASTNVGFTSAPQTLIVSDAGNQPLTFSNLAVAPNFAQVPSGAVDCTANLQLSSAAHCSVSVAFAPMIGGNLAGSITFTDTALNNSASAQTVLATGTGTQQAQIITFPAIPNQTYGVGSIALNATASSGLGVTYTLTFGPASVSGNTLTILGAGQVAVQANQMGDAQYASAPPVSQTFTVNQASTSIIWATPAPITYGTPLGAAQLNAAATPVSAGLYLYSPAAGATLNAGSQTLSVQFTATDPNYAPSTGAVMLQVNQAGQTITFPPIPTQTYGTGAVQLNATASSGLTVSYSVTAGPATVSGNQLTLTGVGAVTVQASQAGNGNYTAAGSASQTFTVNPGPQTITFSQNAPGVAPYNGSFTVAANASSGLPVSFASAGVCTNVGATFTMTKSTGTCIVTASQPGNSNYLAAATLTEDTTATKATPSVTFTGAPPSAPYQATFTVVATSNSGVTPTFASTGSCSNRNSIVTMTSGTGTCTATAAWAGNSNYVAATAAQTTIAQKATSIVTWSNPAPITYPTKLGATQLNATANVAGKFVYSPASGSSPAAGLDSLAVTFTPTQNKNYAVATYSVVIQVIPAATAVVWQNPAPISSGTPLAGAQLDASATPVNTGTYVYTPPAGTVLSPGSQTLSVQFTPTSPNYSPSTGSVTLVVNTQSASQFQHIVIVFQENRTPDNIFGSNPSFEPGVDIATSGTNSLHQNVPLSSVGLSSCYGPDHTHVAFVSAYDGGAMDGSDLIKLDLAHGCVPGPNPQFRFVDNSSGAVQPYFDLATQYGFANRMFQSNQGPSFPAHQFIISGTSAPTTDSNLFAAENPNVESTGCTTIPSARVQMVDPNGIYSSMYPCFDHATLIDLLSGAGLTWRYYAAQSDSIWTGPNAISALCNAQMVNGKLTCTGQEWSNVIPKPAAVLTDIQNCKLASVTWVTPAGQNSDHPRLNTGGGPSWVASIVNAIGNSPCGYWQNTAILITWDDWGGWYDHVPPYRIGQSNGWGQSYVYGFRVPLLVVSAYTPAGYVSNSNHDFGSLLKFVETNFNLGLIGPGNYADSYADDLQEFFSLASPKPYNSIPAKFGAKHFINSREKPTPPDDD